MELFNQNSLSTDSSGNVSFSGLRSGIDFRQAVDSIMEARRIPVDRLETRIEDNTAKISALNTLGDRISALRESVNVLRGAVSLDRGTDVFAAKQAFLNASRSDSASPSQAAEILGVNVTNKAEIGTHQIEVLQRAAAHKFTSGTASSTTDDLGTALNGTANSVSGNFSINGQTISVLDTDSLVDLRDRINNANSGTSPTGVSASIISVSSTEHVLTLTADATGETVSLADDPEGTGDPVLQELGIWNASNELANELQAAQDAELKADGLTDASKYESDLVASDTATLDAETSAGAGSFTITNDANGETYTVNYDPAVDSLNDLATRIDGLTSDSGAEDALSASVVSEDGQFRLNVVSDTGEAISFSNDQLVTDLGIAKQDLVITRSDNTIDDLFQGMTLDLFKAEPGTTVEVGVERNLNQIKSAINGFVDAYNGVKQYLNAQRQGFALEGQAEEEVGALSGNRVVSDVEAQLSSVFSLGAQNVDGTLEVLGQIGIDFRDDDDVSDPTRVDTLAVDEAELNDALLNSPEEVRDLFAFDFNSADPSLTMLDFSGDTQPSAAGYQLDITHDGTEITSASLDGSTAAVTFSGNTIKVTDESDAQGLSLFYSGGATAGTTVDFNVSRGIGANMHAKADDLLDDISGPIETAIDDLKSENERAESNIERMERRLAYQREQLTDSFIRMEEALAEMETIRSSLQGLSDSLNQQN